MTKSSAPLAPRSQGISLPNKQDVFVGFATVPGFVSFTSSLGSPYLQVRNTPKLTKKYILKALASVLSTHYKSTDMSDIHLLVKRRLAALHLGRLPHPVIIATNCILSPREGGGQAGGRGEVESAEQAALLKASQRQGLDL